MPRDPVSVLFDEGARALLARAYAARGQWAGTRLADPGPRHLAWLAARGISPLAPDNASAASGGGLDARSRWMRGFIRALYYQHRWYSSTGPGLAWRAERRSSPRNAGALEVRVGNRVPVRGVIPAGRAVRVRVRPGGQAARRAVQQLGDADRIYDDAGRPAGRWSDPSLRDW